MSDQLWLGFCTGVLTCIMLATLDALFRPKRTTCLWRHRWGGWQPTKGWAKRYDADGVVTYHRMCERCGQWEKGIAQYRAGGGGAR